MKKAILILLAILALQVPSFAPAQTTSFTVLLAGGSASNMIHIWLTPDGRSYVIDSIVPLEVGGTICGNPEGNPNELICPAPAIAGFEINADGGDDRIAVAKDISIPVTMRGGSGRDVLIGGAGPDKLIGGVGDDRLTGWRGDDLLAGGPGDDVHFGGIGNDVILSGPGNDVVREGKGNDVVRRVPGGPPVP
ncbi:MAG TPA: calcium-binding protein [Solirubrobacterales bacterium]|nr:calcium-binding protein [Solirubrobacterales bacterium]